MVKLTLEPGRKYRGSFMVNEYGEFQCWPEQTGTKPSNLKIVRQEEDITIRESKNLWKVEITFRKSNMPMNSFLSMFSKASEMVLKYIIPNK